MHHKLLSFLAIGFGFVLTNASQGLAQTQVLATEPPNVEFQYQLFYPRIWGPPGPGLSLGGSLPSKGREGISSLYGLPFPAPLGGGVYANPFGYATRLPGPNSFGLASNTTTPPTSNVITANNSPPLSRPADPQAMSSNASAVQRSREMELIGDGHFRDHNWNQARINYQNAIVTAPERAEPHFRLAIAQAMLESYREAAGELMQAITIDPTLGQSLAVVDELIGRERRMIPSAIALNIAKWAKEDLHDQKRLLLLAVVLKCAGDDRSEKILAAISPAPYNHDIVQANMIDPTTMPLTTSRISTR